MPIRLLTVLSFVVQSNKGIIKSNNAWFQKKVQLRPAHRGCHLITEELFKNIPELTQFSVGLCHVLIQHTSASLTLNEVS